MDSAALFAPVAEPDTTVRDAAAELLQVTATSRGSTGRLGELAGWYSACWGEVPPQAIERARLVVFSGQHAVASPGVTAADPTRMAQLTEELATGAGSVNALARAAEVSVQLVDVSPDLAVTDDERLARASAGIDQVDAMSPAELEYALKIGRDTADREVDSGADVLIPGSLGVGGDIVAAVLVGALTRTEPVAIIGSGYELDAEVWKQRVSVVRDAMFRVRGTIDQPLEVLRMISSPDIAALVAFCAQAAVRRTPLLIDDPVVAAAALVADRLAPGARLWFQAVQLRSEPIQRVAFRDLGLEPLLELQLELPAGAGALPALPLLRSGVELIRDVAGGDAPAEEFHPQP